MSVQNLGRILCRGNAIVCSAVIACDKREAFAQGTEKRRSNPDFLVAFWIASLTLAMTASNP
jgi:hypothetical protein